MSNRHEENESTVSRLIQLKAEITAREPMPKMSPSFRHGFAQGVETVVNILCEQNKDFREIMEAKEKEAEK